MERPKANLSVALFTYAGTGGSASMSPDLCLWLMKFYHEVKMRPDINFLGVKNYSDTPITYTRCLAVEDAKKIGADMILMLDSDNIPDGYLGQDSTAKPFFPTAYDFAYERLVRGIPTVIAAPYCGPPPPPVEEYGVEHGGEVPYLFEWSDRESDFPHGRKRLSIMTRNHASRLAGIYPVAALPTGVCLFTLSAFEGLAQPYFRYEFDKTGSKKNSTEDVVATRDISLYWKMTKGYDVLFAACDSWAFHVKTKKVGRPQHVPIESISEDFADAIRRNWAASDEVRQVDYSSELPAIALSFTKAPETPLPATFAKPDPEPVQPDYSRLKRRWEVLGPDDTQVLITEAEMEKFREEVVAEANGGEKTMVDRVDEALPVKKPQLTSRMIGRHKVQLNGSKLPDEAINGIQNLARYVSEKNGGPIKAAVIHPKTGEGTAALMSVLLADSRIHAYDWGHVTKDHADTFRKTFKDEIDRGIVKADIDGKEPPNVAEHWSDMALFEDKPDGQELERWFANVSPRGLLCGIGYDTPDVQAAVNQFKDDYSLPLQIHGTVWAIPVGDIAHA